MATGQSTYASISSLINDIHAGALFTLRQQNVLVRTVRVFNDSMGMQPRTVTRYGAANPREVTEGDDVLPTVFDRSLLETLTPATHADMFLLTDQRVATDEQNVRADAALELGSSFATYVDEKIATNFASLTGGTVGTSGSALTWTNILSARAILQQNKVPGPYFCALHPYQWLDLVLSNLVTGNALQNAPQFQDGLVNTYFVATIAGGVTFVVTPSIVADSTPDAVGAMYAPLALAYDERRAFRIAPQRDESRSGGATELNGSLWFAHGVWDAVRGVQIISDVTAP